MARLPSVCALDSLGSALGCEPEPLADTLSDLEDAGLIRTWDGGDEGLGVVLSPLAAERLGVHLDGRGERWVPLRVWPCDDALPSRLIEADVSPGAFESMADPTVLGGLDGLIAAEDGGRITDDMEAPEPEPGPVPELWKGQPSANCAKVPAPTLLIGIGLVGYVPATCEAKPCPACHGRKLAVIAFCLVCCRSGVGHLLQPLAKHERPKAETPASSDGKPVESRKGYVVKGNVEVPEKYAKQLKGKPSARDRKAAREWEPTAKGYRMDTPRRRRR